MASRKTTFLSGLQWDFQHDLTDPSTRENMQEEARQEEARQEDDQGEEWVTDTRAGFPKDDVDQNQPEDDLWGLGSMSLPVDVTAAMSPKEEEEPMTENQAYWASKGSAREVIKPKKQSGHLFPEPEVPHGSNDEIGWGTTNGVVHDYNGYSNDVLDRQQNEKFWREVNGEWLVLTTTTTTTTVTERWNRKPGSSSSSDGEAHHSDSDDESGRNLSTRDDPSRIKNQWPSPMKAGEIRDDRWASEEVWRKPRLNQSARTRQDWSEDDDDDEPWNTGNDLPRTTPTPPRSPSRASSSGETVREPELLIDFSTAKPTYTEITSSAAAGESATASFNASAPHASLDLRPPPTTEQSSSVCTSSCVKVDEHPVSSSFGLLIDVGGSDIESAHVMEAGPPKPSSKETNPSCRVDCTAAPSPIPAIKSPVAYTSTSEPLTPTPLALTPQLYTPPALSTFEFANIPDWLQQLRDKNEKQFEQSREENRLQFNSLMAKQREDSRKLEELIQRTTAARTVEPPPPKASRTSRNKSPFSLQLKVETTQHGLQVLNVTEKDDLRQVVESFCVEHDMQGYDLALLVTVHSAIQKKRKADARKRPV